MVGSIDRDSCTDAAADSVSGWEAGGGDQRSATVGIRVGLTLHDECLARWGEDGVVFVVQCKTKIF